MLKPATQNIIDCLSLFSISLPSNIVFTGLCGNIQNDSRLVMNGDVFCAVIGHEQDGRNYINKAISQGAALVLSECEMPAEHGSILACSDDDDNSDVLIINFYRLNHQLFALTKAYYQSPQDNMTIVGITGTNGKTTTSQLLAQMLNAYKEPCAIIGTNGAGALGQLQPIDNTTPGACELHQLLNYFNLEKFHYVAMEVSSHALMQKRVEADLFDIALFTNLSRDHLDYHGSMEKYGDAKKQIFTGDNTQTAIVNFDDAQSRIWLKNWPEQQVIWLYGIENEIESGMENEISFDKPSSDSAKKTISAHKYFVSATQINRHSQGVSFTLMSHLGDIEITSPLLGDFNIDNLLASICVLLIQGVSLEAIPDLVAKTSSIAGRMEATNGKLLATAVVDYAHTPDALAKALQACRQHCDGELYVVFGCGGDRDKGKRPLMAQAAEKYADHIIVTNDNPRSEDEQLIANDILAGFSVHQLENVTVTLAREEAVLNTLKAAKASDIVLLAGKGHEDYIIMPKHDEAGVVIGTEKLTYNERLLVSDFYQQSTGRKNNIKEAYA